MNNRAALRQLIFTCFMAFLAIFVLLKSDLLSYVAYSVEKGRLRAIREGLPTPEEMAEASLPARDVARLVSPAVVFIETSEPPPTTISGRSLEELLEEMAEEGDTDEDKTERRRLLERHLEWLGRQTGVGSGFVSDADNGFIVTNYHVIENAATIDVQLADGRRYPAEVVGTDPPTDLAVIRIEADRLYAVEFGDSEAAQVGDAVFALGNPFRLAGTVSRGIISGKGRHSVAVGGVVYQGFLQTDAVINPGNSGGPLVNLRGEVVGVNTAIATQSGHYDGVGFAIPSSRVAEVLPKLVRGEKIERGFLGILPASVAEMPERAADLGWAEPYGVLVVRVVEGSGAEAAGLRVDDVVIRLDGVRMEGAYHLVEAVGQMTPGATISLDIWRNGERLTVEATLGVRPDVRGR